VASITSTFHFFFLHSCTLRKESCYIGIATEILDYNKDALCQGAPPKKKKLRISRININRNHTLAVQFATLAHELGHLFLGHLGPDRTLNIPQRSRMDHAQVEFEAEFITEQVNNPVLCIAFGLADVAHFNTSQ